MMTALRSRVPLAAAACTLLVHVLGNPHYGFFRDELYFIICGRHPALGYVDQPPIVPLLAAGSQLFGPSLWLLRAVVALFAAASVYVTCVLARELGGGRFAEALAALGAALCPVLCSFGMKLSTDTVGLWLWPLLALYLLRLARGGDPRLWLRVGVALGAAVLAKYSVLYYAVALVAALALSPQRRLLASRWFVAGAAIAIALALPNFLWQARHHFPMLELLRNGQAGKNVILSPLAYVGAELLITSPILALVWLAGLVYLLRDGATRFLGVAYLLLLAMMIASHAKHYYPANAYPLLFAAGGVAVEAWTAAARRLRPLAIALVGVAGLITLPYVLPVLPVPAFLAYHARVGGALHIASLRTEHHRATALPQDWADMQAWPELAATVERVYRALPADEQARAAIVASNYGEAGAIDFFGHGLPPVLSGHNQYFLWGTRCFSGDVVIDVHGDCGAGTPLFASRQRVAVFDAPLAMPYEDGLEIWVCRGITKPLAEIWPGKRDYQ